MKALLWLLGQLPLTLRVLIGRTIGWLVYWIPSRERRVAELQMRVFLGQEYSPGVLRSMYASFGQTAFETLNLNPILGNLEKFVESPDWPLAQEILAENRPIVTLTAHLGNWDLLAAYCIKMGVKITTIGKELKNEKWHDIVDGIRSSYGIETIWRRDPNAIKTILQNLSEKRVVAALIDQDTEVSSSYVPFFGIPVRCPSGLVVLAKRSEAILTAAFVTRIGWFKYRVSVHRLDEKKSIDEILADYHSILETHIRRSPEQWVWMHKRWRSLPDGERLSSRDYLHYLEKRLQHG